MIEPTRRPDVLRWVLLGLALLTIAAIVANAVLKPQVPGGNEAPHFTARRLDGTSVSLRDLRGKVVLLNFWATWCPPCVEELPSLVRLAQEYESKGVVFLAATQDAPGSAETKVQQFLRRMPALAPFVIFPGEEMDEAYKVEVLPTLYFIGRNGEVLDSNEGFTEEDAVRAGLEKALAAPQSP